MSQVIFWKASPQKVCEGSFNCEPAKEQEEPFGENMPQKESISCHPAKEVEESFDCDPTKRLKESEDGNHSKVNDDVWKPEKDQEDCFRWKHDIRLDEWWTNLGQLCKVYDKNMVNKFNREDKFW